MRILIVEDDELTANALKTILASENYAVEVAKDGEVGGELIEAFSYDLVLLDVVLPKQDGISLCKQLRSRGYQMPILLLTGRDSSHEKAVGLDAGADDYVIKPCDAEELVARVRALLRRSGSISLPVLEWGNLKLDPTTHEVTYKEQPLPLTPKEYALLELFLRNHRRVFSCGAILEHLWSYGDTPGEEAVRTHIKCIRHKLKTAGASTDFIETVYGIGYRLKPLSAAPVPPTASAIGEVTRQQTLFAIAGVWHRFKDRVRQQVDVLEEATTALLHKTLSDELHHAAEREAHTLAGSLGTFGLAEGSQLARKIEHLLQTSQSLNHNQGTHLRQLVRDLRREIEQGAIPHPASAPEGQVATHSSPSNERPLLLIVDRDRHLARELVSEAHTHGIQAEIATNLASAKQAIEHKPPHVILLDLSVSPNPEEALALLAHASQQTPPIPVLVCTAQDDLTARVEVARRGGRAFLHKPIPSAQVLETVAQVLQRVNRAVAKVMIVDDDPKILATISTLLEPWGLKVTTLDDARRFWETLEEAIPDLLILDVKMPYLNGIELCQVVRNDTYWGGLPILILTAHTDTHTVNQVFAVGADDFISKPIVGPELVTRIVSRLERIKLLRHLTEIDPLTGVSNRPKSTQDLNKFLNIAKQSGQVLCLGILNLNNLKQINERYGHATGDAVLRQVGQRLLQSFHGEDIVSRWGGGEFVVGMYGITKQNAAQKLTKVLEMLSHEEFISPDGTIFRITLNAGVAQYPEDGTDLPALHHAANGALTQAKLFQLRVISSNPNF